jgi:transcriptional regulator with XRE-family HTH domain
MDEKQISKNIKKYRTFRGLSLGQLAQLTGLTKGYVSKIERSDKAPPFSTLVKLAGALGIDTNLLIEDDLEVPEDTRLCIVRKDQGKTVATRETLYGYHYEALAHKKAGKNMQPYLITPAFDEKGIFSHEGEEFLYVLKGTHEFIYDGERYILEEGDCVYFDSIVPHSGRSVGTEPNKLLAVMYYYKRIP